MEANIDLLTAMGFDKRYAEGALEMTGNDVQQAASWLAERADAIHAGQTAEQLRAHDLRTISGSSAEPALGVAVDSAPVVGIPRQGSLPVPIVVHPDGREALAFMVAAASEPKLVLVVRSDLRMSAGKTAAQCAHAALGLYRSVADEHSAWLTAWESTGEKTVVVSAQSGGDVLALESKARELGLATHLVRDAGRTEVDPGSVTVVAIGGLAHAVDEVTGSLPLL